MGVEVEKVNILGLDHSGRRANLCLGDPVKPSQIVRDWHIWLKSLVIIKPCTVEGGSHSRTINAMEQLLLDALDTDSGLPVLTDPGLLELANELKQIRDQLKRFNQTEATSMLQQPDESTPSDTPQEGWQPQDVEERKNLEEEKNRLLKKAKEAFEEQHLSIEILQQFWRKHLIPAQQQQHAEKYVEFLTQYGHQGGILSAYIMGLQKYAAQKHGHLINSDIQFSIKVSARDISIEPTYFIKELLIGNEINQHFYEFCIRPDKQEGMVALASQVRIGVNRRRNIDITCTGFGKGVTSQFRQNYNLTVYPIIKKEMRTGAGGTLILYEKDEGRRIESPVEKANIIQELLMWLENFIEQIKNDFMRLLNLDSEDTELSEERQSLLS